MATRSPADDPEGIISASLVILILVATAIGGLVGLVFGSLAIDTRITALVAGFVATVAASIARYTVVFLGAHAGVDEARIPTVLVVNAAIASIAGSLAAHDLTGLVGMQASPLLLGAMAGLLSAVLMAMLMITYHTHPSPRR
jgi:hypothetical protein